MADPTYVTAGDLSEALRPLVDRIESVEAYIAHRPGELLPSMPTPAPTPPSTVIPAPVATVSDLEGYMQGQGATWPDAWNYYAALGYDMTGLDPNTPPTAPAVTP